MVTSTLPFDAAVAAGNFQSSKISARSGRTATGGVGGHSHGGGGRTRTPRSCVRSTTARRSAARELSPSRDATRAPLHAQRDPLRDLIAARHAIRLIASSRFHPRASDRLVGRSVLRIDAAAAAAEEFRASDAAAGRFRALLRPRLVAVAAVVVLAFVAPPAAVSLARVLVAPREHARVPARRLRRVHVQPHTRSQSIPLAPPRVRTSPASTIYTRAPRPNPLEDRERRRLRRLCGYRARRAITSACESASARPRGHRALAPTHFVPVPSATTTGRAFGVASSVSANPARRVYSPPCGLPCFGSDAYFARTASATAAPRSAVVS
eukprot:2910-Pelagococcus_subviridis.AAC.7